MISSRPEWDDVVDVVVVGSGAAGLVAATLAHDGGASVTVLEKADLIGGTTGVSGGMPWIPMNRHMAEVGVDDARDDALTYIRRLTLGREPDPELVEVYVDTAPEMLDYLEAKTPLRMSAPSTFNDYYAHLPGGKRAGRSIEPVPFDARAELGAEQAARVRTSPHLPWLTMDEGAKFLRGDGPPDVALAQRREADDVRVLGSALVASLFKGLLDRGVNVTTGVAARELVVVDGEAVGVRVEDAATGASRGVGARRGVVLACGGFEWNDEMVRAFVGQPLEPMGPPQNEGDGLAMAMSVGARLANMASFWGQPAISEPGFELDGRAVPQMASVRSIPGVIVVNRHGLRFVNEGVTYQDLPKVNATFDPVAIDYPNEAPHWIVFDQRVKDGAVVLPTVMPGQPAPGWITQAPSLRELASAMGVDGDALERTVAEWNDAVARGEDPQFRRGTTKFEVHMSGRDPSPRICMAPLGQPPFYAIPLRNGTLGTNGGPLVDRFARIRRFGGGVVPGLYAAGNVSASVFGPAYPGGGATIGPAMTFGYLAGRHAAQHRARDL